MLTRHERELRRKRPAWHALFFLFVFLPLLTVFPYIRAINNPNEYVRVFTVMSLVESGSYRIDEQVATFGWVNDMARVPGNEDHVDHYYMVKAPAILYPALPGYLVFSRVIAPIMGKHYPGVWGGHWKPDPSSKAVATSLEEKNWWLRMATWSMRLTASNIPCFLFLLWFERYLRSFTSDTSIRYAAVTACGLGTNYLAYTHMFASHSQYAAIAFIGFALIETEMRRAKGDVLKMRWTRAMAAGWCVSAAVTLEYHALFMCVLMSLYATLVFWRPFTTLNPTRLLAFALGGLSNIPHMMYFHWTAYGNPLTPGHQKIENVKFQAEHHQGLWGILWPTWDHVKALAIDPSFGFFGMSPYMWIGLLGVPVLLLAPYGPPSFRRSLRATSLAWFAFMVIAFGVNAGFVEWRAGWTIGPRYLVVCAPFFAFGAVLALERFAYRNRNRRAMARGMGGGLALAGVLAIGVLGIIYDTLPENIPPPFATFSIPMARIGMVPHHIGEWFGVNGIGFWYVVCAALVLCPFIATFAPQRDERRADKVLRALAFVTAAAAGIAPQFVQMQGQNETDPYLFVLHPTMAGVGLAMEPPGRDRITKYREEAESMGLRGRGPCVWYRLASLERTAGMESKSIRDEAKAKAVLPKEQCSRWWW